MSGALAERQWSPRTRRAEPLGPDNARGANVVAPHTQSGTVTIVKRQRGGGGRPAHAERNLHEIELIGVPPGSPRTRRAEPHAGGPYGDSRGVAPHTQSGTDSRSSRTSFLNGRPAHAERNRTRHRRRTACRRSPRTRRAEPPVGAPSTLAASVAPHTQSGT